MVTSSEIALYADDSKIFKVIKSQDDSSDLQADLQSVSIWGEKWEMMFNIDKCKTMSISRKRSTEDIITYSMNRINHENVKTVKDLGITV